MKKLILLLTFSLIFTGCFDSDETTPATITDSDKKIYDNPSFQISIPIDWEIAEKNGFTSNVAENTTVAFINNIKDELFTANVNIITSKIEETVAQDDFIKTNKEKAKTKLLSFQEIGETEILVPYSDTPIDTMIYEFQGKDKPANPLVRFKQLYIVNSGMSYTITAAYLPNEDEAVVKYIDEMLNSLTLK